MSTRERPELPHQNERLWTRLRCSRCRYSVEHPGPVTPGDLDGECPLCRAQLAACTVYRLSEPGGNGLLGRQNPSSNARLILGHKDPSITITVYSHWFDDAEEEEP